MKKIYKIFCVLHQKGKLLFFLVFMLVAQLASAQEKEKVDTTQTEQVIIISDSTKKSQKEKKVIKESEIMPRRAALRSAIIPGWGQVQNKQYWKVPIVYIGMGTVGYMLYNNHQQYRLFRDSYIAEVDDDPSTVNTTGLGASTLKRERDNFRKQRDLFVFVNIGVYAFQIIDAYVFAHLIEFDISDDLSLEIYPSFITNIALKPSLGLSLNFTF